MSTPPTFSTGASAPLQDEHDALPAGTRLAEFEILRVLGIGGFGIVYLAMDHALDRMVAVKEYMPSSMAARGRGTEVSLRSSLHQDTFHIGLRSFVNEAKLLARFNHPSLVKVYRFWEANGTAYMAMPFYPGRTLKDERRAMLQVPDEQWLRGLVDPLLGAMEVLHKESVYHRDIAPDNILLLPDGPPVLLDFGAARAVIGDRTQSLTAVLKPSYAPIEQYADVGQLRQGPWTDLYALGAVLHFVVTGRPPTPSASRAVHDDLKPLTTLGREHTGSMPLKVLKAIDWALTVSPQTRPQNVQAFRDALDGRIDPPLPQAPDAMTTVQAGPSPQAADWARTEQQGAGSAVDVELTVVTHPETAQAPVAGAKAETVPAARAAAPTSASTATAPADSAAPGAPSPAKPRNSRALPPLFEADASDARGAAGGKGMAGMLMALGAVVVLVLGLGFVLLKDRFAAAPAQAAAPAAAPAPAPVPVILAAPAPTAAVAPAPAVTPATLPVAPPAPAITPAVAVPDWSSASRTGAPASAASAASATPAAVPSPPSVSPTATPAPRPKPRTAPAPTATVATAAPTPRDVCNARSTGSMSTCMHRVCTQGPLVDHAQCVQLRRDQEW
ncbi:serine/threonine protein kinase [Rhizobacter sp. LjRoot28]|uniref:serine/threonine protein kinase n=1 Tax=Rhizobacter sp. LjRoot28 TaxID=3342309 RepID=UPI003ECF9E31